jgi:tetratricopeptide (TPR) repeat protein
LAVAKGVNAGYGPRLSAADEAVRLAPDMWQAWYVRAMGRKASGDVAGEAEDLTHVIELGRSSDFVIWERRTCWRTLGKVSELTSHREEVDRLLQSYPRDPDLLNDRADCLVESGNWLGAADDISKAIELEPYGVRSYYRLADIYIGGDDKEQYRATCDRMVSRFRYDRSEWIVGNILDTLVLDPGCGSKVADYLVVAKTFTSPARHRLIGAALYRAGRSREALEEFQESRKVEGDRAWHYLVRAMIYHSLGERDQAIEELRSADRWIEGYRQYFGHGPHWTEEVETRVLRQEAVGVIGEI